MKKNYILKFLRTSPSSHRTWRCLPTVKPICEKTYQFIIIFPMEPERMKETLCLTPSFYFQTGEVHKIITPQLIRNVIDQGLVRITSTAGRSNKTADNPFKVEYGSMPSFCSALVYISRNRNRWPVAQRNRPPLRSWLADAPQRRPQKYARLRVD